MSLEQIWHLQQLELEKARETTQTSKERLKNLMMEKEALLAREEGLRQEQDDWEKLRKAIRKEEHNLDQLEARKKELKDQLYSGTVPNPKELSHLEEQVGNLDAQIDTLVERYLELEEKAVEMEKTIEEKHKNLVKDKKQYKEKTKTMKAEYEADKARIEVLDREIKAAEAEVAPQILTQYRRLQKRLGVIAVAEVQNGVCKGCGIQLPTLLYQQIRLGESGKCENCGRILLIPRRHGK